jgi:hypothetical protein
LYDQLLQRATGPHLKTWYSTMTLADLCDTLATIPLSFQPGTRSISTFI